MEIIVDKENIIAENVRCFSLPLSVDCGQAFRWKEKENGVWHGVVLSKAIDIKQEDNRIIFYNTSKDDFENIWKNYFDFSRDYEKITDSFCADEFLQKAVKEFYGIRVLNQDPWETLCSFIISQNNNIPRIKGIIERLCENFGEKISDEDYSFPSAERIAKLSLEDLSVLRAGFRAKYILDAAKKVSDGEIKINELFSFPIDQARTELMKICGVGPKVAECTLLYSCKKAEAFPIDVWVKRIISELYPNGLPECMGEFKGIAQQYLFHWRRNSDCFKSDI